MSDAGEEEEEEEGGRVGGGPTVGVTLLSLRFCSVSFNREILLPKESGYGEPS